MTSEDSHQLEVEVETAQLAGGEVELSVRVPPAPVGRARDQAVREFARRASIPGFRKGKAPRAVVERYLDPAALDEQIVESLLEEAYDAALEKAEIKALNRARIADAEIGSDGALTFTATVAVRPEITLGEYKGMNVTRHLTAVTDAQVEAELERLRSRHAQFTELPEGSGIGKGDLAVVDYDMLVEGEKRDDASASGYPLEVGEDRLFPELNEALLGAVSGETREVEVQYQKDHSDPSLAGRKAVFQVTVKQARRRQLPALDDEFAKRVSELEGVEALRSRIRQNLEAIGRALADEDVRSQIVRQLSDSASLDVPQALVDRETDRRIDEITEDLERRDLTLHQHLRQIERSFEDWRADLESDARQVARRALILDEIGQRENLQVGEEEIREEMRRVADAEGISEEHLQERLHDSGEFSRLVNRLYHRKILQFLADHAEITDEVVEPEEGAVEAQGAAAQAEPAADQQ